MLKFIELFGLVLNTGSTRTPSVEITSVCWNFLKYYFQVHCYLFHIFSYLFFLPCLYGRRENGKTIPKNGVIIDNRNIVAYNPKLLRKYKAHINVEWFNQNTSIKYLFKYINK